MIKFSYNLKFYLILTPYYYSKDKVALDLDGITSHIVARISLQIDKIVEGLKSKMVHNYYKIKSQNCS